MAALLSVCLIILAELFLVNAVFIDPQFKLVENWAGWGTSLAGYSHMLGGFDQAVQDKINYDIYSPERLNFNIVRYLIGGTTPGDESCGPFRFESATESYKDGPDQPFIWTRDANSRKILLAVRNYGVDTFEAFSNSPPSWLTRNGCTKGTLIGGPLYDNFDPEKSDGFADYLSEVVKYYREQYGVTFTSLAPFNEPSSGYWRGENSTQEGCNMKHSTMVQVIKSMNAALAAKNLTFCKLSVGDETNFGQEIDSQRFFTEAGVAGLYSKVNAHGYGDSDNRGELASLAAKNGHTLWMDEVGWRRSDLGDMEQGLNVAERIVKDLRNLVPNAWVYWQAMEDQHWWTWGLLDIPYWDARVENIRYNSGFYSMMHFSKYIKKGFSIVQINDEDSVAAFDEKSQTLILVTVNTNSSPIWKQFDLSSFASLGKIEAFRTSPTEPHVSIMQPLISTSDFSYEAPARSVTTFKIQHAIARKSPNLLVNGDFESGQKSNNWFLQGGYRWDGGINGHYVRRGLLSGNVYFSESGMYLMQNVTVPESRRYFASGWCSTSGPNTKFGISINGITISDVAVAQWKGYRLYGLHADAKKGDVLSIYIYGPQGHNGAEIDDAEIH